MAFSPRAIEEVAKFEQRISFRRGKPITLENTPAFKSLDAKEKREFSEYIKSKKRRMPFLIGLLILSLIGALIFRFGITGSAISENVSSSSLSIIFSCLFLVAILVIFVVHASELRTSRIFKKDSEVARRILMPKK